MPSTYDKLFIYVVPPKSAKPPVPTPQTVPPDQYKLLNRLSTLFIDAEDECSTEICFEPGPKNEARDRILAFALLPGDSTGHEPANRLVGTTPSLGHTGLLFLMAARSGGTSKVVAARFPAIEAVVGGAAVLKLTED